MKPFLYIGIDPGLTGAIAFYLPLNGRLVVRDMPTRPRKDGRRETCPNVLAAAIERYVDRFPAIAAIEKVGVMTGKEARSDMFSFGRSFGIPLGVLAANRISAIEVPPAVWKGKLGLDRDKKKSLQLARELFPRHQGYFRRVKDNGRAEAALLAHWAHLAWGKESFELDEDWEEDPFE